jgi:carboxymethylenebutenolidase
VRRRARPRSRAARRTPIVFGCVAVVALAALTPAVAVTSPPKFPIQEGQTVTFTAGKDEIKAYFSRPVPMNAYPGVVVIHEWWGLNDQIKGVADRLAGEGYLAIVPDLYRGKVPTDAGYAHDLMRGVNENWAVGVIEGAASWLRATDGKERRRAPGQRMPVATVGFCFGGRLSLATALKGADTQAMVMFYGSVETQKEALKTLKAPLLGIFGNEDHGIPLDQVKAFEAALRRWKKATILVYTGVGHASSTRSARTTPTSPSTLGTDHDVPAREPDDRRSAPGRSRPVAPHAKPPTDEPWVMPTLPSKRLETFRTRDRGDYEIASSARVHVRLPADRSA